nr:vesicular, overexpressed in cancer, prosurvival protein 1 isoform X2 [Kogia breviceps]
MGRLAGSAAALLLGLLVECTEAKKHCWYFEGLYPTYYICRPYEDCCGSRCCVRALSIQRLWYFWFLLMMGVLFCCGAGFFIRRRMYPPPLIEEPAFNVSYTRQPSNPTPEIFPSQDAASLTDDQRRMWRACDIPSAVYKSLRAPWDSQPGLCM